MYKFRKLSSKPARSTGLLLDETLQYLKSYKFYNGHQTKLSSNDRKSKRTRSSGWKISGAKSLLEHCGSVLEEVGQVVLVEREEANELEALGARVQWLVVCARRESDRVGADLIDDPAGFDDALGADHHCIHSLHRITVDKEECKKKFNVWCK